MGEDSSPEKFSLSLENQGRFGDTSTEAQVSKAKVIVHKGERYREAGEYITKKYKSKESRDTNFAHWQFLKKHGFPVPLTVRPRGDDELLVTDLTQGGKKLLFSVNSVQGGGYNSIHLANREILKDQLRQIAEKADSLHIGISADAPFLLIDESGNGEILLGDFGAGVAITPEELKTYDYMGTPEAMKLFWNLVNSNFTEGSYFSVVDSLY